MSDELTINSSAADLKAAIEADDARRHSPEAIGAAVQEFTQRTGYQDNWFAAQEIAARVKGDITADSLQQAAEERLAQEMPLWKLKRFINGE
jgi:hypothetical protein